MKIKTLHLKDLKKEGEERLHEPTIPDVNVIELRAGKHPAVVAIDTECTGLHWSSTHRPFAVSMAWYVGDQMHTAYWDWPVNPYTRQPDYQGQKGLNILSSIYRNPNIIKVFANAKFDMHHIYKAFGMMPAGRIEDVLVMAWCCNTQEKSYKLNDLAEKYLDVNQKDQIILREKVKKARTQVKDRGFQVGPGYSTLYEDYWLVKYLNHSDESCQTYALKDAGDRTLDLYYFYLDALRGLDNCKAYEKEIEVLHEIFRMEQRGVRFHEDTCIEQIESLQKFCTEKERCVKEQFGNDSLNINSDKQLIPYIYNYSNNGDVKPATSLALDVIEWTAGGKSGKSVPSMSSETLKKLLPQDPTSLLQNIIDYRGHNTGIKYFKNYLEYAVKDGYLSMEDMPFLHQKKAIHPSFNQIAVWGDSENKTRTGRLSSSNPNLQNVADPEKSNAVVDAREAFGPREGYVWYCIDYSQLELRLFAERTGGKLKDAFLSGRDPHNETRENVPYLAAMEPGKGRKIAKNTNFTIINCGGAGVLEKKYGVPLAEGKVVVKEFYQAFPETTKRQNDACSFAIDNGYIETITGRKINVDLTQKYGKYIYAYRATSYDIQGSAADIIKRAMVECGKFLRKTKYDAHLVLSIHDELVFEINKKHAYKNLIKALKTIMENVVSDCISIPLVCDVQKTYTNWSSKEKKDVVL